MGIHAYCFQEKILFTPKFLQHKMGRKEKAYVVKMRPCLFIKVYPRPKGTYQF